MSGQSAADPDTPNMAAVDTGSISGRVTDILGAGIADIMIRAYSLPRTSSSLVESVSTDSTGHYTVSRLPSGNYNVQFDRNGQNYYSEWYYDTSEYMADPVAVTAGSITSNIDAQLAACGQISGQVTDESGAGIGNIKVRACAPNMRLRDDGYKPYTYIVY